MTWKPNLWGLAMVIRVFVVSRNLLGDLWLVAAALASGGDSSGEVQSPTLPGENPRSGLNWLYLAMTLLKVLFSLARTFSRVKTYDRWSGDDGACALFPSWRRRYWRSWTSGAVLVMFVLLLLGLDHYSRTFLFYNSSSFFGCVHPLCH
jgi:hypothetical protein